MPQVWVNGKIIGFNPTLVRLRQDPVLIDLGDLQEFQSHAGSIEARSGIWRFESTAGSFNPTLVRLRPIYVLAEPHTALVSIPRWFD